MQPMPEAPTNVQASNPYIGPDRGLFLIHSAVGVKVGRIHAARYLTKGPNAAVGVMEYQVMTYSQMPAIPTQFTAGELLTAPDGTQWFDCLVRGPVLVPILAEYWGAESYLKWYHGQDGIKLEPVEKNTVLEQGTVFTKTMGGFAGLDEIELTATFNITADAVLERSSANLSIDYTRDGASQHHDYTDLPVEEFDPVRVALNYLKVLSRG